MQPGIGWFLALLLLSGITQAEGLVRMEKEIKTETLAVAEVGFYRYGLDLGSLGGWKSRSALGWIRIRGDRGLDADEPIWVRDLDYRLWLNDAFFLTHRQLALWVLDGSDDYLLDTQTGLAWTKKSAELAFFFDWDYRHLPERAELVYPAYHLSFRYRFH